MTSGREAHLVELVDEAGTALGARTVDEAHRPPGLLHRAFSVLLVAPDGRVLLQQRAAVKTRFPLRWANSCCGHPAPGQSPDSAAQVRLREELGVDPVPLTEVGVYLYRAEDPGTGRVEYEYDHVLRGEFDPDTPMLPDPDEVADLRWTDPRELRERLVADPGSYAPWLGGVLNRFINSGPAAGGLALDLPGSGDGTAPARAGAGGTAEEPATERQGGR